LISGFPRKNRFHASEKVDGIFCSSVNGKSVTAIVSRPFNAPDTHDRVD
jgi:hypothetical protein